MLVQMKGGILHKFIGLLSVSVTIRIKESGFVRIGEHDQTPLKIQASLHNIQYRVDKILDIQDRRSCLTDLLKISLKRHL